MHYSHFALNDAPTLAPLALRWSASPGSTAPAARASTCSPALGAGRRDRDQVHGRDRARDGDRRGVRLAGRARARAQPRARASALIVRRLPGRQPVRAARPPRVLRRRHQKQTETAGEDGGKLGLANTQRLAVLPDDVHLGLRLAAVAVRARRRSAALIARHRRLALLLAPGADPAVPLPRQPVALLRPLDAADLPDPLPARGLRRDRARDAASRPRVARVPALRARWCSLQGLVFSVHNDLVLAKADTRMVARDWMVAEHPGRARRSSSSRSRPTSGRWTPGTRSSSAAGGTGTGNRWNKWRTSRSCFFNGKTITVAAPCPVVKIEDYERTTRPALVGSYEQRRVLLGRHRLDPVRPCVRGPAGRAGRAALLRRAQAARRGRLPRPARTATRKRVPFSFDYSFNYYPLDLRPAGAGDRDLPARMAETARA